MIEWGISAGAHDASLCVTRVNYTGKTKILFASHAERYSGVKNDKWLNQQLIDAALKFGKPSLIHWYEKPWKRTLRRLICGMGWNHFSPKKYLRETFNITTPIKYASHHESHAAAGFYTSPFDRATVLVIDAIGEFDTASIWICAGERMKKVWRMKYPNSLGLFYSAMTDRVGLKANEDEYILMGMVAYGLSDRYFDQVKKLYQEENLHRGCKWWNPGEDSEPHLYDIAAATQKVYEEEFEKLLQLAKTKGFYNDNLVLMGGCALNCSANHIAKKYFKNVWIMPNPGDAGSSLGAVAANTRQKINWKGPYLGHQLGRHYPVRKLLDELQSTGIVGVASGKAEFGPRALGNRSLLADPRGSAVKDKVNEIKHRQKFRPFAPVIMAEYAKEYFDMPVEESPYMQFTARCKFPDKYPAIVHADGTSRVQTVTYDQHPGLYTLLRRWYALTGCPMLLNTSLNIKGMPMVNNSKDADDFEAKYGVKVYT
jgi:carbamoyltransferase